MTPKRGVSVFGYVRVSTDKQGLSPGAQEERIRDYCRRHGLRVAGVFREEGSAGTGKNRPVLDDVLGRLDAGEAGGVVVASLDRLARSVVDFAGIIERAEDQGWVVVCLSPEVDMGSPGGRMVAQVIMAMAEYERALISQRTRAAMASLRERDSAGHGLIDRGTEDVILGLAGEGLGLRAIARQLDRMGVETARGGAWNHRTVGPVLERARERHAMNGVES